MQGGCKERSDELHVGSAPCRSASRWGIHSASSLHSSPPFASNVVKNPSFATRSSQNSSYFFWYDIVGWSFLWLTMTVWTSLLLPELRLECFRTSSQRSLLW